MQRDEILNYLRDHADPQQIQGMAEFGIQPKTEVLGVRVPVIRDLAKQLKKDHVLAQELWQIPIHELRILATMIAIPAQTTPELMDTWVADFDSWDLCDQACSNLFCRTPSAYAKVVEWSARPEEFMKRAGLVLIAYLAIHDKKAPDEKLTPFFPLLEREACDERNFVKKAVNWALRQMGKRNLTLNQQAIEWAERIQAHDCKAAKWVAADALRELRAEKTRIRLEKKAR